MRYNWRVRCEARGIRTHASAGSEPVLLSGIRTHATQQDPNPRLRQTDAGAVQACVCLLLSESYS